MKKIWDRSNLFLGLLFCIAITGFSGCRGSNSILKNEAEVSENPSGDEAVSGEPAETLADGDGRSEESSDQIFVDVCGAVKAPGVYRLPAGSRIYEAIAMAGGFLEDAESTLVNQAGVLEDGQQIHIYTKEEVRELEETHMSGITDSGGVQGQRININLADKETLMTLDGIGETRAEAIIAYRESTGGFSDISDLTRVDGIKEKTYEKLKDKITVQ